MLIVIVCVWVFVWGITWFLSAKRSFDRILVNDSTICFVCTSWHWTSKSFTVSISPPTLPPILTIIERRMSESILWLEFFEFSIWFSMFLLHVEVFEFLVGVCGNLKKKSLKYTTYTINMQCVKSTIIHVLNEKRILEEFCDDGLEGTFYYFFNPQSSASFPPEHTRQNVSVSSNGSWDHIQYVWKHPYFEHSNTSHRYM